MARRPAARKRPVINAAPRSDVVQSDTPVLTVGGLTALLESATQPILAVTYWFDPAPHAGSYPITVRFSGRRNDVKGRLQSGDKFVQDETIEEVVPGSGPISLTARVRNINAGKWTVTAQVLESAHPARAPQEQGNETSTADSLHPVVRFWRRWAPSVESTESVHTCLTPFAHVPGILLGIWGTMVVLGMVIALTLQALVISGNHLAVGSWWAISPGAIAVGIIGAKVWYIIQYRRQHQMNGWCIQGFITGATLTAAILLVVLRVPAGIFLDATAPGLLFAMAVGRIGCFFAGCCGGPLTASRWGVWSSDQRVGARRIPTQLMESVLALSLGLGTLVAFQIHGSAGGAFFVGGLAAYTLVRQCILHLRAERPKTRLGAPITVVLSALVLVVAVVLLAR
jgi:phosphatidylglycerol---prolipoprotein diacylglyceryl transferase